MIYCHRFKYRREMCIRNTMQILYHTFCQLLPLHALHVYVYGLYAPSLCTRSACRRLLLAPLLAQSNEVNVRKLYALRSEICIYCTICC